jgi:pimeloyl-ACP methyl ester carboxylesterase
METRRVSAVLMIWFACCLASTASGAAEEKFIFETRSKHKIEAFRGSLTVPENRSAEQSRSISLRYVRLPATGAQVGPPIVYLAGGPGGSGIAAIDYRYDMFMVMRQYGDVIALDQRGTGASNSVPRCESTQVVPVTRVMSDDEYVRFQRAALNECFVYWQREGVDLAGYDTVENARDLDALRRHLGAAKIVLWGTSYGSHLALAALKEAPDGIARVVLSSVEGLDQTIKLPAQTDAYLVRLQQAIDSQPAARAMYGDVAALMRRVHAKLERQPVLVKIKSAKGTHTEYLLQRRDMQILAGGLIADPRTAAQLLNIYRVLDAGEVPSFDGIPGRLLPDSFTNAGRPIALDGMPVAMDLASGLSAERRSKVYEQAKTAILGIYLDNVLFFDGMATELDLGDAFRAAPTSSVPVLAFSGSLDGRTTLESQRAAVAALKNATLVSMINAGHNLFDIPSDELRQRIDAFMHGKAVSFAPITVELPDLAAPAKAH